MDTNAMMDMMKAMQGGGNNNLSAMLPTLMSGMNKGGGGGDNNALMSMLPALMGGMGKGGGGGDNNALMAMLPALMGGMGKGGGDNSALTAMLPALMGGMNKGGGDNGEQNAGKSAEYSFDASNEPQPIYFENKRHRRPVYAGADSTPDIDYQKIRRIEPNKSQREPESANDSKNDMSGMLSMLELMKGMNNKGGARLPDDIAKLSQIEKFAPDNIKQGLRAILSLNSVFSDSVHE